MAKAKPPEETAAAAPKPSLLSAVKGPLLLPLVNSLVILLALGLLVFTRILYKRPVITEESEREKIHGMRFFSKAAKTPAHIPFDPIIVNIAPIPSQPKPADGTLRQLQGKLHYATVAFTLEIRDSERQGEIEALKPKILDKLLSILGRKKFHELTTVQGRYLLRTQILDFVNELVEEYNEDDNEDSLVTNVFFTQFIVQ